MAENAICTIGQPFSSYNSGHIRCVANGQAKADVSALAGNATSKDEGCCARCALPSTPTTITNISSPTLAAGSTFVTSPKMLDWITAQQQEAQSLASLLQQMTQALLYAQQLVQNQPLQDRSNTLKCEDPVSDSGLLGSAGADASLQAELTATRVTLSTALTALNQIQTAHRLQQETITRLQHQLHEHECQQHQTECAGKVAVAPAAPISQAGAAVLAMVAGAGAASLHIHQQQQQLEAQLAGAMQERQVLLHKLEVANDHLHLHKVKHVGAAEPTC